MATVDPSGLRLNGRTVEEIPTTTRLGIIMRVSRMEKGRLLAFTDGVIAVIITIMVLDLKVPQDASTSALATVTPVFISYVLSFLYVAIY